ncbi:OPN5-like protein [Mya arenaria]|uniref:OPN5-like protein n=1 Tax=Mya arenaria TaxID=6604 RepID=A0ABY7G2D0_MYAAR|nr:OPN5-like protein [Mya arenaria]
MTCKRKSRALLILPYIYGALWSAIPFVGYGSYEVESYGISCSLHWADNRVFTTLVSVCCIGLPAGCIVMAYGSILSASKRSRSKVKEHQKILTNTQRKREAYLTKAFEMTLCQSPATSNDARPLSYLGYILYVPSHVSWAIPCLRTLPLHHLVCLLYPNRTLPPPLLSHCHSVCIVYRHPSCLHPVCAFFPHQPCLHSLPTTILSAHIVTYRPICPLCPHLSFLHTLPPPIMSAHSAPTNPVCAFCPIQSCLYTLPTTILSAYFAPNRSVCTLCPHKSCLHSLPHSILYAHSVPTDPVCAIFSPPTLSPPTLSAHSVSPPTLSAHSVSPPTLSTHSAPHQPCLRTLSPHQPCLRTLSPHQPCLRILLPTNPVCALCLPTSPICALRLPTNPVCAFCSPPALSAHSVSPTTLSTHSAPVPLTILVITFAMCLAFLGCWMPYAVVSMWAAYGNPDLIPLKFTLVAVLIAKSSIVINPVIYFLLSRKFRPMLRETFHTELVKLTSSLARSKLSFSSNNAGKVNNVINSEAEASVKKHLNVSACDTDGSSVSLL